jgi:ribosomal-protein-alanine N-acetyltransferase
MNLASEVTLRRFSGEDLEKVMEINRACLPENYSPHFFLDVYKNCPDAFLVAEVQGKVVGYVMCRLETGLSDLGRMGLIRKGHIVSIAVMQDYRRRGIASALMLSAISALASNGSTENFVEVRVTNEQAMSLYKKLGFRIVRRIPRYYYDGVDAYAMTAPTSK